MPTPAKKTAPVKKTTPPTKKTTSAVETKTNSTPDSEKVSEQVKTEEQAKVEEYKELTPEDLKEKPINTNGTKVLLTFRDYMGNERYAAAILDTIHGHQQQPVEFADCEHLQLVPLSMERIVKE